MADRAPYHQATMTGQAAQEIVAGRQGCRGSQVALGVDVRANGHERHRSTQTQKPASTHEQEAISRCPQAADRGGSAGTAPLPVPYASGQEPDATGAEPERAGQGGRVIRGKRYPTYREGKFTRGRLLQPRTVARTPPTRAGRERAWPAPRRRF